MEKPSPTIRSGMSNASLSEQFLYSKELRGDEIYVKRKNSNPISKPQETLISVTKIPGLELLSKLNDGYYLERAHRSIAILNDPNYSLVCIPRFGTSIPNELDNVIDQKSDLYLPLYLYSHF